MGGSFPWLPPQGFTFKRWRLKAYAIITSANLTTFVNLIARKDRNYQHMMRKWEYDFIDTDEQSNIDDAYRPGEDILRIIEGYADVIGKQGWELVAVVPRRDGGYQYVFKRQIQAE